MAITFDPIPRLGDRVMEVTTTQGTGPYVLGGALPGYQRFAADGIVSVAAKDLETGLQQSITVTATSGLTEDEIRRMVEANKDYMVEVRSGEEFEKHKQTAERLVDEIEQLFPKVEEIISGSDFGQDAVRKARSVLDRAKTAIASHDMQSVIDSSEALTRTLNMFKGVVSKTKLG